MSLFTRPVIVGLIIYSNCCLLQQSKMCKGGYCISGAQGWWVRAWLWVGAGGDTGCGVHGAGDARASSGVTLVPKVEQSGVC